MLSATDLRYQARVSRVSDTHSDLRLPKTIKATEHLPVAFFMASHGRTLSGGSEHALAERETLPQFNFASAVVAWQRGANETATCILAKSVPLCIVTENRDKVPPGIQAVIVGRIDGVVPRLQALVTTR